MDASKLQKAHAAACFRQAAEKALLSIVERFAISTILFPCKHLHMSVVGIEILDQLMYYGKRALDISTGQFHSFEKNIELVVQNLGLKLRFLIECMQFIMHGVQCARGTREQLFNPLNKAQFNPPTIRIQRFLRLLGDHFVFEYDKHPSRISQVIAIITQSDRKAHGISAQDKLCQDRASGP